MKTEIIEINYKPHEYQFAVHKDNHRFKTVVWHRQAGKTTLALNELIKRATIKPGSYFYIAPTYRQAKMIAWDKVKEFLPDKLITKKNESELMIELFNGSKIYLKGSDNPDSLRGVTLEGVVLDEYQSSDSKTWFEIIYPTLSRTNGWAIFIGTPRGKGHFYELYRMGMRPEPNDWKSWILSAEQSGLLPKEAVEQAKKTMPLRVYDQEYNVQFKDDAGVVFDGVKFCVKGSFLMPDPTHHYVMGVDLAKSEDFTVITVIDKQLLHVVYFERVNQKDWNLIKAKIEATARRYNNCEIRVDVSGAGSPILEDLMRQGLNIEGFVYTNTSKRQLIENLMILIQQQQITFPPIEELINELEIFTFDITPSGNVQYQAPKGFHDDCVNSLALAVWQIDPRTNFQKTQVWQPLRMNYH